ncbi:MAG: hypothetical protein KGQ52_12625 [Alphaproteobacteria bacterium]|nr:hypothetical protein [Alphaproteobacteria bacterium]
MSEVLESPKGQLGFDLGETKATQAFVPDIEDIRAELKSILHVMRTAGDASPWDVRTLRYHKTVFPQMSNWLPEDERTAMRTEFARELARIEAALAA